MTRVPRKAVVLVIALLLPAARLLAQPVPDETLDQLYGRAREAITRQAYESAVGILKEAKTQYPASPKPSVALGDLYYDQELYALALTEYRDAEKKGADDFQTLTQISRSYGKLNREPQSIDYLKRILKRFPESTDTVDDLGWMYFKTHQLRQGEEVLLDGINRLGLSRSLAMTLGTVYSGMNQYDRSRQYYQKAIDEALGAQDRTFAAIAYYNLALLEHNYYQYNSALRSTEDSIAMEDRPSGHLARGELFESRMEFDSAWQEYQQAYAKDDTPLSKVNMAILLRKFGRLELASRYAEDVLSSRDLSWMVYYGTDTTRHVKDMHELLQQIDQGLAQVQLHRPTAGPLDRLKALWAAVRYAVEAWQHRQRFRLLSVSVGDDYLAQGSNEDAWWEYYRGNEGYPEVALKYLELARSSEVQRSPHAAVFYQMEEGRLRRSVPLLRDALPGFDPYWEKGAIAEDLTALIPLLNGPGNRSTRRDDIVRLYQINPGALPQAGLGLPLHVEFTGNGWKARERAIILRLISRSGSEIDASAPYSLRFTRGPGGEVRWIVMDPSKGAAVREGTSGAGGSLRARCSRLVQSVLDELYAVH
ncbi:MAG TPA: hypothetical protein VFH83_04845 [Spirochaetia bacterium]|nr:hypothetical protein [Spirochaetia bacterium]